MLLPYPSEMPSEAWQLLWDVTRGTTPKTSTVIHTAWVGVGYVLGKISPDGPFVMAGTIPDNDNVTTDVVFAQLLSPPVGVAAAVPIPWALVLQILLRILTK